VPPGDQTQQQSYLLQQLLDEYVTHVVTNECCKGVEAGTTTRALSESLDPGNNCCTLTYFGEKASSGLRGYRKQIIDEKLVSS
jgi:hypothetical protein